MIRVLLGVWVIQGRPFSHVKPCETACARSPRTVTTRLSATSTSMPQYAWQKRQMVVRVWLAAIGNLPLARAGAPARPYRSREDVYMIQPTSGGGEAMAVDLARDIPGLAIARRKSTRAEAEKTLNRPFGDRFRVE